MPDFAPRPERLGLGAKYVPHSAAMLSTEERSLSKKLKPKPSLEAQRPAALEQDSDDGSDEGRSASVRSKRKRAPLPVAARSKAPKKKKG